MGNLAPTNKTKQTADILNEFCTKVVQESIQNCSITTDLNQIMNIYGGRGDLNVSGISFKQVASINLSCVMKSEKQAEIANSVAATIAQFMQQRGGDFAIFGANNEAEAAVNITNSLKTNIRMTSIQESILTARSNQQLNIYGSSNRNVNISDIVFDQDSRVVSEGILSDKAYADIINKAAASVAQTTEQKTGVDISGNVSYYLYLFMLIMFVAIFGYYIYGAMFIMSSSNNNIGISAPLETTRLL